MLSLHNDSAANAAANALNGAARAQSRAARDLGTGYRVNSAADDAAGLQIATRLATQASGTQVALRNIQNGISLMQAIDGLATGQVNTFARMRDLAVQAADGSTTLDDRKALQAEFEQLYEQVQAALHTRYNGEYLVWFDENLVDGKAREPFTLQTGADAGDVLRVDLRSAYFPAESAGLPYDYFSLTSALISNASQTIGEMDLAVNKWSEFRSAAGAVANRLEHAYNNASNLLVNTKAARGRIMDTDFAEQTAQVTVQQMLVQSSTAMLKQSRSVAGMVVGLIQG